MSEKRLMKLPPPPDDLNTVGRAYWFQLGRELIRHGNLTYNNLEQFKNLTYWEQQKEEVHELLKQGSKPFVETANNQVEETRGDVLISNLKAINNEINKLRKVLSLEPEDSAASMSNSPVIPQDAYDHLPDFIHQLLEYVEDERQRDLFLLQLLPVFTMHLPGVQIEHADGMCSPSLSTAIASTGESAFRYLRKSEEVYAELKKLLVKGNDSKAEALGIQLTDKADDLDELIFKSKGYALLIHDRSDLLPSQVSADANLLFQLYQSSFSGEPLSVNIGQKRKFLEPKIISGISIFQHETLKEFGRRLGKDKLVNHLVYISPKEPERQTNRPSASSRQLNRVVPEISGKLRQNFQNLEKRKSPLYIDLTDEQWEMIDGTFHEKAQIIKELKLTTMLDRVNRNMAVAVLKMTAIFAVLRAGEENVDLLSENEALTANNSDVIASLWIADTLLKHAYRVYQELPEKNTDNIRGERYQKYFFMLPAVFKTVEAVEVASKLDIPERTAKRYLSALTKENKLLRMRRGTYQKSSV